MGVARDTLAPVERDPASLAHMRKAERQPRTDIDARRARLHRPRGQGTESQRGRFVAAKTAVATGLYSAASNAVTVLS